MFLLRGLSILLLANIVFGESVLELTDIDFATKTAQHETVLVMFYAPW